MPYEVGWHIVNRIVLQRYLGDITIDDLREITPATSALIDSGIPLVHTIADVSMVNKFPTNIPQLASFIANSADPNKHGWMVIVGARNPMLRFIASMLTQVAGTNMRLQMADTIDEAIAFLKNRDESLTHPINP